ncbi:glycosyltransferase [Candidatus Thiodictyon syntrophicum]|uniref:glycosyltransferase n=1 Tax=Candidatus Thiodictyon syntrophicum TaxID=1166950 RepID=UPI001562BCAC|nr:glycosyltransferase [Candidatus Thiodictyon syntrophicum]
MRVLNLIQCTNLGGMEVASLRLMRGLMQRGHRVELLSLHPLGALAPLLAASGIAAEGLTYRGTWGWRSLGAVRAAIARHDHDALLMTGHNLIAMLALDRDPARRRVLAIHYHHLGVKPRWQWRLIYSMALARFDAITFPSDFVCTEAQAIQSGIARIAHTVRNPIDLPPLPDARDKMIARAHFRLPPGAVVIGNAGHLIARKRFDVFLDVAARVSATRDGCYFLIAGDGELRGTLEAQASRLGIGQQVVWAGRLPDLASFYSALDVLLFNSDQDALGMTPLEAMSYGVPVVASSLYGGLKEVIRERAHGILLDRHDTDALAAAVIECLRTGPDRPGHLARARVSELTPQAHTVGAIESLLSGGS